jgi:hypothetical protein
VQSAFRTARFQKGSIVIVEHRMYTLHVGKLSEYMKHYEELGMKIQTETLGAPVGWYYTEVGMLNQIIHMWAYESFEDRLKRRAELAKNPGWQKYLATIQPLVVTQETKLMIPAPWFTPKR